MGYRPDTANWITLPPSLRQLSGGTWHERCYPFCGVFSGETSDSHISENHRRLLEDFRITLQTIQPEFSQPAGAPHGS